MRRSAAYARACLRSFFFLLLAIHATWCSATAEILADRHTISAIVFVFVAAPLRAGFVTEHFLVTLPRPHQPVSWEAAWIGLPKRVFYTYKRWQKSFSVCTSRRTVDFDSRPVCVPAQLRVTSQSRFLLFFECHDVMVGEFPQRFVDAAFACSFSCLSLHLG